MALRVKNTERVEDAYHMETIELDRLEIDGRPGSLLAGIDGETVRMKLPLRFRVRPAMLKVRTVSSGPGAAD